jgi:rod shape determining protein RodA
VDLAIGQGTAVHRRLIQHLPWQIFVVAIAISALGVWNLASAARQAQSATPIWQSQLVWFGVATVLCIAACVFDYHFLLQAAWPAYGIVMLMLVGVLLRGRTVMGAQRWLDLGPLHLQPSEFAKLAVVLVVAKFFHEDERNPKAYELRQLWLPLLLMIAPVGLIMKQPDLGTAIMVLVTGVSCILFARVKWQTVAVAAALGVAGGVVVYRDLHLQPGEKAWILRKEYQKKRVMTFLDPEADALGAAYHANQSEIAVGSGRFSGKGWGKGTQTQLSFLPAQHTDFAFSVWAEEQGFVGAAGMVALYTALICLILWVAASARDKFGAFVCVGVAAMLFWHMFINIGMVTKLLPVVGVPLPLMSYGGSAVVTVLLGLGIVANVGMRKLAHN